jgi:hypothetical protein
LKSDVVEGWRKSVEPIYEKWRGVTQSQEGVDYPKYSVKKEDGSAGHILVDSAF